MIQQLLQSETAKKFFERVEIGFSGYNQDPRELYEIVEVRHCINKLDDQFPFWLIFPHKTRQRSESNIGMLLPAIFETRSSAGNLDSTYQRLPIEARPPCDGHDLSTRGLV
jgi:hypothetical protein